MRIFIKGLAAVVIALIVVAQVPATAAELVVFEEDGCPYCVAWNRDIGDYFHLTDEARVVTLRRVSLGAPIPKDLRHIAGIRYTPTFVVLDGATEIGRITGYIGQYQFWGRLGEILEKLKPSGAGSG